MFEPPESCLEENVSPETDDEDRCLEIVRRVVDEETALEMVAAFERATGVKIPVEIAPRRPGDVAVSYATAKLAETELGWKTKYTLDDMCKLCYVLLYHTAS